MKVCNDNELDNELSCNKGTFDDEILYFLGNADQDNVCNEDIIAKSDSDDLSANNFLDNINIHHSSSSTSSNDNSVSGDIKYHDHCHCKPSNNTFWSSRMEMRNLSQRDNESFSDFSNRTCSISNDCDWKDRDIYSDNLLVSEDIETSETDHGNLLVSGDIDNDHCSHDDFLVNGDISDESAIFNNIEPYYFY